MAPLKHYSPIQIASLLRVHFQGLDILSLLTELKYPFLPVSCSLCRPFLLVHSENVEPLGQLCFSENASLLIHACSWCMKTIEKKFPFLMLNCYTCLYFILIFIFLHSSHYGLILLFVSVDKGLYINSGYMVTIFMYRYIIIITH